MTFRFGFLAPLLGFFVFGGCDSTADDAKPTVTRGTEAAFRQNTRVDVCAGGIILEPVGEAVMLSVESRHVLSTCQCQTTSPPYGCGTICESEYDLGGPNTPSCSKQDDGAASLSTVSATVGRSDCRVEVVVADRDQGAAIATLHCSTEGPAHVTVTMVTEQGTREAQQDFFFTSDGMCPPPPPPPVTDEDAGLDEDATTSDAGVREDASDAGDGGGEGGD